MKKGPREPRERGEWEERRHEGWPGARTGGVLSAIVRSVTYVLSLQRGDTVPTSAGVTSANVCLGHVPCGMGEDVPTCSLVLSHSSLGDVMNLGIL